MNNTLIVKVINEAHERLKGIVTKTPLERHAGLSARFGADIYLKREDLQVVRSYKLRGAYNRISLFNDDERKRGVVCASAGNHAQGVAFSCAKLGINGTIFMPKNTPRQKIERVRTLGGNNIEIMLTGDTFDTSFAAANQFAETNGAVLVHPFDDLAVIAGQGTVAVEIFEALPQVDVLVVPVGGGGLISGVATYAKSKNGAVKVIGVEPEGAPSMDASLKAGHAVTLDHIDTFVDGVAVKTVGENTFAITQKVVDAIELVPEGRVCRDMIGLYQSDGIVAEPAGALSVAALENIASDIHGKTVVCVISGGNNDISRYAEVLERSLIYQGLKHYFIVEFSQRPGALRAFLDSALGATDDITLFEYVKKNNRETGPALVGIELAKKGDLAPLLGRMTGLNMTFELIRQDSPLFRFIL